MTVIDRIWAGEVVLPLRIEDGVDRDTGLPFWIILDQENSLVSVEKSEAAANGVLIRIERDLKNDENRRDKAEC